MSGKLQFVTMFNGLMILACAGVQPQASFAVEDSTANDSCTGILDYCVTVRCAVKNVGDVAGPATVTFELGKPDGTWVTASQYLMLNPRQPVTVAHDFNEAELGDEARYRCSVERAR